MSTNHTEPHAPAKPDNLLGICAALGADFGFNPLWLRIALGAGILWNPAVIVGTYLALGLVVLATRLAFPDANPSASDVPVPATLPVATNSDEPELALAA
jgi:phage shock protein PspC (stress-responsive transcriptional regulator)